VQRHIAHHSFSFKRIAIASMHAFASVCALSSVVPTSAHAKDVDVYLSYSSVPTIYVEANDGTYNMLSPEKHNGNYVRFEADIDILGGQDRIRRWDFAPRMKAFGKSWGWSFDSSRPPEQGWGVVGQSYGFGDRPKTVRQRIVMLASPGFVKNFAVDVCNASVAALRSQGKSESEIFRDDRTIQVQTTHKYTLSYTNIADTDKSQVREADGLAPKKAAIVCMKVTPIRTPTPQNVQVPLTVTQSSLMVMERASANGACKVILSGVVQTNLANREVKFRYEHTAGNKSEVKTASTDHSKTAFFSHEYDVPNNPNGNETGMIRMVGVSPNFETAWKSYAMSCVAKAPSGLQSAGGPTQPVMPVGARTMKLTSPTNQAAQRTKTP
jgi:flagellar basal body rod protein FlgC